MEQRKLNPVNTPRVTSRRAAWLAWEASVLGKDSKVLAKVGEFSKAFTKALKESYGGRLKYFVHGVRTNRGEVKLISWEGAEVWFNIVNQQHRIPSNLERDYQINPDYERYHFRQTELLKRRDMGTPLRHGYNIFSVDLWFGDFLEFEDGFIEDDQPPRWQHYVDVYNDLGEDVDYVALSAAGTIVSTIYLAAQMHSLNNITIAMLTRQMRLADSNMDNNDCFMLLYLALGYGSESDALANAIEGRILNRHFQE